MLVVLAALLTMPAWGQSEDGSAYATRLDVLYYEDDGLDAYAQERCRLDVYYPERVEGFSTVVWFHGGGLVAGERYIPGRLKNQEIAVVSPNYRLSPRVEARVCIEDAAAAVAWTMRHVAELGGDPARVYVSGHSAGGYLTSMVGLDRRWLGAHGLDPDDLAGLVPFSGHTITHFTVRSERGVEGSEPRIDELAPLWYLRKDCPPMLLITGDRELELLGRYEENAYFWRMMRVVGHERTELRELKGFNHGEMVEPGLPLLLKFVRGDDL
ncbi:alpha/beta hydrolase [Mucisphaera calidilacus]|nr:alpha/beta hydrolase [Mucisphaera calidilacus]